MGIFHSANLLRHKIIFFYSSNNLSRSLPRDILNLILKFLYSLELEENCRWIQIREPIWWEVPTININKSKLTFINRHFDEFTPFQRTPCIKIRYKPVWTVVGYSANVSCPLKILCIYGDYDYDIDHHITIYGLIAPRTLGSWYCNNHPCSYEQITIDVFNAKFIVNGKPTHLMVMV